MEDKTIRWIVVCVALVVMVAVAGMASCSSYQFRSCVELKQKALETNNPILAATIRCGTQANSTF